MKLTPFLKLFLPSRYPPADPADIDKLNSNFTSLDTMGQQHAEDLSRLQEEKTDLTVFNVHVEDQSNPHSVTKAQLGLSNVDNTADLDKPISAAQKQYVDEKMAATGSGDMLKSVYDPDNDGIVDVAGSIDGGTY